MLIPNNIGLDPRDPLHKQLVAYQSQFRRWFRERGPAEFLDQPMRLRLPTGQVHGSGWAAFDTLPPADYTWGVYMVPTQQDMIAFGQAKGHPIWHAAPSEYRSLLLDHIRVQADVENAAIEQSRSLTGSAPSHTDLNNLFQFFLEEGRHTWAMVHLLIEHFGHDGMVEAEALLGRMSGDVERPRLLDAFNYHTDDWLSHFMWCFLADRVGKYQIQAVTQSAFAPLARAAKFMMFEEPLHITFGAAGLERVLCATADATLRMDRFDVFEDGRIPLPVIQKYFNYWCSKIFDLFGNDESARANDLYQHGIRTPRNFDPATHGTVTIDRRRGESIEPVLLPAECVTNTVMRHQYAAEVTRIVARWNAFLKQSGIEFEFYMPHERFNRTHGPCRGLPFDVKGELILPETGRHVEDCLPTPSEVASVHALMRRELRPDHQASWLAAPGASLQSISTALAID